jgi:hypothetical protein
MHNNELSDLDITNILTKHKIPFNGVFSKNLLPKDLKYGWYIINMQSSNQGDREGTHWVSFKYDTICEYIDSFGFIYPIEILQRTKGKTIIYNKQQIQDINSSSCGWFAIGCIGLGQKIMNSKIHLKCFNTIFSSNPLLNDTILQQLLIDLHI